MSISLGLLLQSNSRLSTGFLCGVLSYLFLCKKPQRGDLWVALELFAVFGLFSFGALYSGERVMEALWHSISVISIQVFGLVASAVFYRLSPFHPLAAFPGPLWGRMTSLSMVQMVVSGNRFRTLVELHKKYGTFVRTGPNAISINSSAAIGPIYSAASAWHKSAHYSLGSLPGSGLFWIQDRDIHNTRKRHFWTPAFTSDSIASYYPILDRRTDILLDTVKQRNDTEGSANLTLMFQHWAHDVTGDLTFGDAYDADMIRDGDPREAVKAALLQVQHFEIFGEAPSLSDIMWYLPVASIFREMDESSRRLLNLRRSKGSLQPDLMTHLVRDASRYLDYTSEFLTVIASLLILQGFLSSLTRILEVTLAILAGTNAVSASLTYAVFFLGTHPEVNMKLKHELQTTFPDFDGTYIDHQVLITLPYLNAVVEESFRLGCPVGALSRVAPKGGAFIAGKFIPEGTIVSVPPYAQSIAEENFYPSPLEFRPERWLPGGIGPETRNNRNALMVFSHGPFGCLGKPLAYHQIRVVLAKMVLRFDFKFVDEFDPVAFMRDQKNLRGVTFLHDMRIVLTRT